MSLADIRKGIGANLATIRNLRVAVEIPDNPSPPIAVLGLNSATYDKAFKNGLTTYEFNVQVIVGRVAERDAQRKLDSFIAGELKAAVESDKTLGGSAYDVIVTEMSSVGTVQLGDATYLAADFSITVYSN